MCKQIHTNLHSCLYVLERMHAWTCVLAHLASVACIFEWTKGKSFCKRTHTYTFVMQNRHAYIFLLMQETCYETRFLVYKCTSVLAISNHICTCVCVWVFFTLPRVNPNNASLLAASDADDINRIHEHSAKAQTHTRKWICICLYLFLVAHCLRLCVCYTMPCICVCLLPPSKPVQ